MVHGAPDNYQVQKKATTFRLDDMAELAVRLGSPSSIDRLGEVIFFDDFTNDLGNWVSLLSGVGASIVLSGDYFKSAGFSCKLTAGSTLAKSANIKTTQSYLSASKIGLEISFNIDSNVNMVYLYATYYTPTIYYLLRIILHVVEEKLYLYNSVGVLTEIASNLSLTLNEKHFYTIKVVGNLITSDYIRLRFNGISYDISAHSMQAISGDWTPSLKVEITVYSAGATNGVCYLDNIIITQNEP